MERGAVLSNFVRDHDGTASLLQLEAWDRSVLFMKKYAFPIKKIAVSAMPTAILLRAFYSNVTELFEPTIHTMVFPVFKEISLPFSS